MKDSKFRILMYINLVLLVLSLVGNIYGYYVTKDYQFIFNIDAIVFSLVYLIYGYKKHGAGFFMYYMIFLAIKEGFAFAHMYFRESVPAFALIIVAIMLVAYIILAFVKNLGKRNSYILCGVIIVLSIITLITGLKFTPTVRLGGTIEGTTLAIYNATRTLMAFVLGVMVYAKYEDKYARGTK